MDRSSTEERGSTFPDGGAKEKVTTVPITTTEESKKSEASLRSFTVQLFPKRLISFLEQAERYARMAFSPLFRFGKRGVTLLLGILGEKQKKRIIDLLSTPDD